MENTYTKYIYIKSTTVYVPSSELGRSHPLSRQRVCPSPRNQTGGGEGTLACGWGVGEFQTDDLEKSLAICLLSGRPVLCYDYWYRRYPTYLLLYMCCYVLALLSIFFLSFYFKPCSPKVISILNGSGSGIFYPLTWWPHTLEEWCNTFWKELSC